MLLSSELRRFVVDHKKIIYINIDKPENNLITPDWLVGWLVG